MWNLKKQISLSVARNPGRVVLGAILLFNLAFFFFSALIISHFPLKETENMGFIEAAFCTITMILDAGCIQFVVQEIGEANVGISIFCLIVILLGMISFTGAVIGYVTNLISGFIENANAGGRKLHLDDHIVILNWNNRASEIVNDLLYCEKPVYVVLLVPENKDEIRKKLEAQLQDTVDRENRDYANSIAHLPLLRRLMLQRSNRFRCQVKIIVREGDVFSSKQLNDISLDQAETVIILGSDRSNDLCVFERRERNEECSSGNSLTVKSLMQVADITAAETSRNDQKIIVEITDGWTWDLVQKIIRCKQRSGKCNIVPVRVNTILGQLLSQFSLMPELNMVYRELFSNKGAAFYSKREKERNDERFTTSFLEQHRSAIPLTVMEIEGENYGFYAATSEHDLLFSGASEKENYQAALNPDYWIEEKTVIILGHNSNSVEIMKGFASFRGEWNYPDGQREILHITVVDDEQSLKKLDYYREYPFVVETVAASIYEREAILEVIERVVSSHSGDTSILILSDDTVPGEEIDANALANLVYVQDIINRKIETDPDFQRDSIDVIVEINDPKHHDVVSSYSANNVIISNRYISKMMTQIGEKETLFAFFSDILTYDAEDVEVYTSKEIYIKKVDSFFRSVPAPCSAAELIRAIYRASCDPALPPKKRNPTITLGYVRSSDGAMILFKGNQDDIQVALTEKDKLIVYSSH